jgi:myosin heavy subunit
LVILPDPLSYEYLCRLLAAVLHLGNLQPIEDDNLDYCEIVPSSTLDTVCKLL